MPMAPEPITSRDFGKCRRHHRLLCRSTQGPSASSPGSARARAPVAMMMCVAATVLSSPSFVAMADLPRTLQRCLAFDHGDRIYSSWGGRRRFRAAPTVREWSNDLGEIEAEIVASQTELSRAAL